MISLRRYLRRFLIITILLTSLAYVISNIFSDKNAQNAFLYKMDIFSDNDVSNESLSELGEPGTDSCKPEEPPEQPRQKLLTIFSTFDMRKNKPYHIFAHKMAIRNWAKLGPEIQPVLFTEGVDNPMFKKWATRIGWDIYPIQKAAPSGAPFLKPMYKKVFETYSSTFYGYANGDILFDKSLLWTLRKIKSLLPQLNHNVMIVGRRHNFRMDLKQKATFFAIPKLSSHKSNARLFSADAEDYFFFTKDCSTFNWTNITDVVVGRPAYDNYLVGMARMMRVNVIDATNTLLALHLSTPNVTYEGGKNKDGSFNRRLIGRFRWGMGMTSGLRLRTVIDKKTKEFKLWGRVFNTTKYVYW